MFMFIFIPLQLKWELVVVHSSSTVCVITQESSLSCFFFPLLFWHWGRRKIEEQN